MNISAQAKNVKIESRNTGSNSYAITAIGLANALNLLSVSPTMKPQNVSRGTR